MLELESVELLRDLVLEEGIVRKNEKFCDKYYTNFSRIQIGRDFVSRQVGLPPNLWKKSNITFAEEELDELKELDSTFLDLSDLSWMDEDD